MQKKKKKKKKCGKMKHDSMEIFIYTLYRLHYYRSSSDVDGIRSGSSLEQRCCNFAHLLLPSLI